ncbi:MAG: ubiquinol-cytochrome C chaperone family protein [Thermodesulfobacteriota bacterium]|nr:ubiquinol-cytochrome C chaperone family protein [Thermodesulfobacteriota bacterium]
MTEIKLKQDDKDLLPLLKNSSNDELDNLVGYITQKGGFSCQLKHTESYKTHFPDHSVYADEIAAEIQKFGGNTIFNILRKGKGAYYRNIVCDVASRLKAKFDKTMEIDAIEQLILFKVLEISWDKMNSNEKEFFLKGIMEDTKDTNISEGFPGALITASVIAGGAVVSYRLSLVVANAVARMTLERGVSVAANTLLSRWISIFAGAIGLGITALWTIFDVAGPAFRVTIPCVLHIAMLRQLHIVKASGVDPDQIFVPADLSVETPEKSCNINNKEAENA